MKKLTMKCIIIAGICILFLNNASSTMEKQRQRPDHSNTIMTISQQELRDNNLALKSKLLQGAKDGIFYVEVPDKCKDAIAEALIFADSFYKNEEIKNKKFSGFSGYHNREKAQVESFYAERNLWKEIFSDNLIELATNMSLLTEDLLKKTLNLIAPHLTPDELSKATGKLSDNKGQYHFSFNHYRPEKNSIGLAPHKDFGFVMVWSMSKPGLIVKLNGIWGTISPKKDYFVVNFGHAFEMLINDSHALTAVLHAVEQIKNKDGRVSFGLSTDGNSDSCLYAISEKGSLEIVHENYTAFLAECFKKTYDEIDQESI